MSNEKLIQVMKFYIDYFKIEFQANPEFLKEPDAYVNNWHYPNNEFTSHMAGMAAKCVYEFIPYGKVKKAHRWLGYIQGELRARNCFTISQLRDHSRDETGIKEDEG